MDDLRGRVQRALRQGAEDFDRLHPGETDRFISALAASFDKLGEIHGRIGQEPVVSRRQAGVRDHYWVAWHLLWDACNGLIAAFSLLQRGYETEVIAVTRLVLERYACAVFLFDNPARVARFMNGRDKKLPSAAVSAVRRVIPNLARFHGAHSEIGAHVAHENIGTSVVPTAEGKGQMVIGGRLPPGDLEGRRGVAEFLNDIAKELLTEGSERVFFDERRERAVDS